MKEVACAVCGALYRFPAAEIPATGKTVTCAKCKARIVVPPQDLPLAGGTGDVIDLADLPMPRRGAPAPSARPPAPSEEPDLVAPKGPSRPRPPEPLTLDSIDLVAPVGPVSRTAAFPGTPIDLPRPGTRPTSQHDNLPAPKGPSPRATPLIPALPPKVAAPGPIGITDLPMPKRSSDVVDLPTPKRSSDVVDLPTPKRSSDVVDLPTPKRSSDVVDLPTPKRGSDVVDLPTPKRSSDVVDLPTPKRSSDVVDLLTPKRPGVGNAHELFDDLPAPKGPALGDLPTPKRASAPDLPTPKRASEAADAARPGGTIDLPAPKGFFDDLPGPANGSVPQVPAPKGFFDDLPGPARLGTIDLPAPRGFFDDKPRPAAGATEARAPAERFDAQVSTPGISLDDLDLSAPSSGASGMMELESTGAGARPMPRRAEPSVAPPPLELMGDNDPLGLELPAPMAAGASPTRGVVAFKPSTGGGGSAAPRGGAPAAGGDLDLAVPARRDTPSTKNARVVAGPAVARPKLSSKTLRLVLAAGLGLAAAGAGGFVMYQRWEKQKERAAEIDRSLATARAQLAAIDRNHWRKATRTANDLLQLAPKNAEAMGIAAQGALAGYLDEGTDGDNRIATGRRFLDQATTAGLHQPALDKAGALRDLIDGDAAAAIAVLQPMAARNDTDATLYLGWAQLADQQWAAAQASFKAAQAARPAVALQGLAQAQAGAGDLTGAHETYLAVIAIDPEHVPALVGEAMTAPGADVGRREAALLAILQRKGIDAADPRAVVQAWTGAGDDARRAGRLDAARDRYRKARALLPTDRGALVSSAALELADGKLELAAEASTKALALAPDDVAANLIAAELDLRRNRVVDAAQRLALLRRRPPTTPELLGRLELLDGMRLEAERNTKAALAAYDRAAQVPGNIDVAPTIAAATLLGRLADAADAAKQPDQAKELRAQADQRLGSIAATAENDANMAITLGVAYLSAGAPAQAERWLRGAIEKRPSEVEAHYQLAEALRRQGKQDAAVATLVKAFELDPTRIDLGVELARGFEAARRDTDAAALYKRLLATKDVTPDVRSRAGRFFARTGDITAAREQGEALLAANPDDAVGMFLKAEGLLADGRPVDARRFMQEAANRDPDAQFYDGLGRASEAVASQSGDTAMRDEALRAYGLASDKDPNALHPRLGAGRIYLARSEFARALAVYQAALLLAPKNPDISYGIGIAYAELEDRPNAIEWLSRAVAAQPRADAYWKLGSLYYEIDRAGAAAAALERARALATKDERELHIDVPWLTDALWLLGTVQQVLGNDRATKSAWEDYLARNPTNKAQADEVRRNLLPLRNY